jgi:hypothetical protein
MRISPLFPAISGHSRSYVQYEEFDNAALTMIRHPVEAWEHVAFKDVLGKISNTDICYKVRFWGILGRF